MLKFKAPTSVVTEAKKDKASGEQKVQSFVSPIKRPEAPWILPKWNEGPAGNKLRLIPQTEDSPDDNAIAIRVLDVIDEDGVTGQIYAGRYGTEKKTGLFAEIEKYLFQNFKARFYNAKNNPTGDVQFKSKTQVLTLALLLEAEATKAILIKLAGQNYPGSTRGGVGHLFLTDLAQEFHPEEGMMLKLNRTSTTTAEGKPIPDYNITVPVRNENGTRAVPVPLGPLMEKAGITSIPHLSSFLNTEITLDQLQGYLFRTRDCVPSPGNSAPKIPADVFDKMIADGVLERALNAPF